MRKAGRRGLASACESTTVPLIRPGSAGRVDSREMDSVERTSASGAKRTALTSLVYRKGATMTTPRPPIRLHADGVHPGAYSRDHDLDASKSPMMRPVA